MFLKIGEVDHFADKSGRVTARVSQAHRVAVAQPAAQWSPEDSSRENFLVSKSNDSVGEVFWLSASQSLAIDEDEISLRFQVLGEARSRVIIFVELSR